MCLSRPSADVAWVYTVLPRILVLVSLAGYVLFCDCYSSGMISKLLLDTSIIKLTFLKLRPRRVRVLPQIFRINTKCLPWNILAATPEIVPSDICEDSDQSAHPRSLIRIFLVSILYKSTAGRYRPVSYPDEPITARYRFIKNAYWVCCPHVETLQSWLPQMRPGKILISLRQCADWSESGLGTNFRSTFPDDAVHIVSCCNLKKRRF